MAKMVPTDVPYANEMPLKQIYQSCCHAGGIRDDSISHADRFLKLNFV
jgi:hypothetical protein